MPQRENNSCSNKVKLIHPIYLDVPMMVSFAAAIEGGVAFDSEVTQTNDSKAAKKSSFKGKFGLSSLFESLFEADVESQAESTKDISTSQVRKEQRAHTEASIAILLYDALEKHPGFLSKPGSTEELAAMEHGSLIELSGQLQKNAIDAMIDAIDVSTIMGSMAGDSVKNNVKKSLGGIRKALHDDRSRTPLSNVILRCATPMDLTAIVTLRTENLRDLTLSELHKNTVRVLGKITRLVGKDETMSPFENYGMSMMNPDILSEIFSGIQSSSEQVRIELGDVSIKGPAIQILPLMVFV